MECDCDGFCQLDDRFQPATRELLIFTKSKDRYFDLDSVRTEHQSEKDYHRVYTKKLTGHIDKREKVTLLGGNPAGAPPLDWWKITDDVPKPEHTGEPMTATFYVGDAIEVMNRLPEKSVDLILTSPPFLALRSYLPADHPDKAKEGGSQATPGEYVDWLLDVVEACARVLAPHGSLCFELGDTYSGSGGAGGDYDPGGWRDGQMKWGRTWDPDKSRESKAISRVSGTPGSPGGAGWALPKSLSLIPETFRFAMVYGVNPHTGRQTPPWRLRNVIRWVRPNPPVGALGDKFRPATSELMVFCKSKDRFFDLDAVRTEHSRPDFGNLTPNKITGSRNDDGKSYYTDSNPAGAPPLDWWNIPLLDGDEPTKGGPKQRETTPETGDPKRQAEREAGVGGNGWLMDRTFHQRGGSPPLDWWNIPLLGEPCPTCDGEGYLENGGGVTADYSHCPTCFGNGWVRHPGPKEKPSVTPRDSDPKQMRARQQGITRGALADRTYQKDGGAPPLDWWQIAPSGFSGAHYAVWPPELLIKPIKAMCPEKVCRVCGEPSRRIVDVSYTPDPDGHPEKASRALSPEQAEAAIQRQRLMPHGLAASGSTILGVDSSFKYGRATKNVETLGFSDCGHDDWRPGLVLDPFAGSGTTLAVATGHGRDAIGIDLDARNFDLALDRVGPFILTLGEIG